MEFALITGASKGIGKGIAEELASRKVPVLLVARSEALLAALAASLTEKYGVAAHYLAIDLADPAAPGQVHAWTHQNSYRVNILVNNAGYGLSGPFDQYSPKEHSDMMRVNMEVPVMLCSLFIPMLKSVSRSYILNIASAAAYQAVPGLSAYAGSKAFILMFSRGLRYELRRAGVSVTVVSPGATDTGFASRAKVTGRKAVKAAERFNMTPEAVAKLAVDAMYARKAESITGFVNKLGAFFVWLLPKSLAEKTGAGLYEIE
jgi:short-subunit dehydrogenase